MKAFPWASLPPAVSTARMWRSLFNARRSVEAPVLLLLIGIGCSVERRIEVTSVPPGATVMVDNSEVGLTPVTLNLNWTDEAEPANGHTIRVRLQDHQPQVKQLVYREAKDQPAQQPWPVAFKLDPLVRSVTADITSNIAAADVLVDGVSIGQTPTRHEFEFKRQTSSSPWNTFLVTVQKDGYRGADPGKPQGPGETAPFTRVFTAPDAESARIDAGLEIIKFVQTPVIRVIPGHDGLELQKEVLLSQVSNSAVEPTVLSVTKESDEKPEDAFMESRISLMPDASGIVFSRPFRVPNDKDAVYANIWMQIQPGKGLQRLTDGLQRDVEATVSNDGKYIYFASDRLGQGKLNIWRIETTGAGGLLKVTDSPSSLLDTEPCLSPDGTRLAYTSYLRGTDTPFIWVCNPDGVQPRQLRVGTSPACSPDAARIAFVAPDSTGRDKVWLMNANGTQPIQITRGDYVDSHPIWTPDGRQIIYASNQAVDQETKQRHFDIWIMNSDGSQNRRLTANASYDSRPAISRDGKTAYFISNRGVQRETQGGLQVWSMELGLAAGTNAPTREPPNGTSTSAVERP